MAEEVSRDEKLAHFEAATGIQDIDECLAILESCNWNLQEAIQSALDGSVPVSARVNQDVKRDIQPQRSAAPPPNPLVDSRASPADERPKRMLEFAIYHGNRIHKIMLHDKETIGTLKRQVHSETGVAPDKQVYQCESLRSLSRNLPRDDVVLASLHLPKYTSCVLQVDPQSSVASSSWKSAAAAPSTSSSSAARHERNDNSDATKAKRVNSFRLDPTECVAVDEPNELAEARMAQAAGFRSSNSADADSSALEVNESEGDDDNDLDYYVADETGLADESTHRKHVGERLMPAGLADEKEAVENFVRVFEQRYSVPSVFFVGTFADAMQRAFSGPVSERRPLAIYLHSDLSVFAHLFCTDVLGNQSVNQLLKQRFYIVPGDFTLREHRERLLALFTPHLGSVVTADLKVALNDQFPTLLVLRRDGSALQVQRQFYASAVHASGNLPEFVAVLNAFRFQFDDSVAGHREQEAQRAQREATRREQDAAYNRSAALDSQKLTALAEADQARADAVAKQQAAERARELRNAAAHERLQPEPLGSSQCVTVKFRHPKGVLTRRFLQLSPAQQLVDYLVVQGFHVPDDYRACFGFPKRFLSVGDMQKTLGELGFSAQELVTLELV